MHLLISALRHVLRRRTGEDSEGMALLIYVQKICGLELSLVVHIHPDPYFRIDHHDMQAQHSWPLSPHLWYYKALQADLPWNSCLVRSLVAYLHNRYIESMSTHKKVLATGYAGHLLRFQRVHLRCYPR